LTVTDIFFYDSALYIHVMEVTPAKTERTYSHKILNLKPTKQHPAEPS